MKALKGEFIPAIFSLDFTDSSEPHFEGYYLKSESSFPQPYFLPAVVNKIINYNNTLSAESNPDKLQWAGALLMVTTYDNDVDYIEPVIITCCENHIVYPVAHGNWSWEHRRKLKTKLPNSINNLEEAKAYLTGLYNNGEIYHPEDRAGDCLNITENNGAHMDKLMNQIYELAKGTDFDPCQFILELDPDYKTE